MTPYEPLNVIINVVIFAVLALVGLDYLNKRGERKLKERQEATRARGGPPPPNPVIDALLGRVDEWSERRVAKRAQREAGKAVRAAMQEAMPKEEKAKKPKEKKASGRIGFFRSFVFMRELRGWPIVRHTAPGRWTMLAFHKAPMRTQTLKQAPFSTGFCVGILAWWYYKTRYGGPEDVAWFAAVVFGVPAALVSIPFWRLVGKTYLRLRLIDGAMVWSGPDKNWWGKLKHRVAVDEPRSLQVLTHRLASQEALKHADSIRRNPNAKPPKPLFQISSELVMHTGPGGSHWQTVAEFCNDESGEKAHRLQTAIEFVTAMAAEEMKAAGKQAVSSEPL
jgi:hypothetical protein